MAGRDTPSAQDPEKASMEVISVPGLNFPGEIIVDQWGVPHIYANDEHDAFFLQGWNAARDRLWQIDLWRKRGLGLLSASFGPAYVEQDQALRSFLYRGDMASEWAAYGKGSKTSTDAFVAGVNGYVIRVREDPKLLPIEFRISESEPEMWACEDLVRIRSHGLTRNLTSEVARARVACVAGLDADALRKKLEPPTKPTIPEGLNPCSIPADVLRSYILATQPVVFSKDKTKISIENIEDYHIRLAELEERLQNSGSNNWLFHLCAPRQVGPFWQTIPIVIW